MRVNNQTSDPVDWEQTGGEPTDPEDSAAIASQDGQLSAQSETEPFTPVGTSPWEVHFRSVGVSPRKSAKSPAIFDPDATVTLSDSWTVSVS